jgi:hypothetical protein
MDYSDLVNMQINNEETYNRKSIDNKIEDEILSNPVMMEKVNEGIELVTQYMNKEYSYESKNARIKQIKHLDKFELVMSIFKGIAYFQHPELFTSATAQIACRLGFSEKVSAITTAAELVAVLTETDAFDITKQDKFSSLVLVSNIPLSEELLKFISNSKYLPPMIVPPNTLVDNYSSGYFTLNESLILGKNTHHNKDICLDVLNIMNSVALSIDEVFIEEVDEEPSTELDTYMKATQWNQFMEESYHFYDLMIEQGNKFYLNHKVDTRGRIYSCGYHINTQGSSYKKAMLNFSTEEIVEGVPL